MVARSGPTRLAFGLYTDRICSRCLLRLLQPSAAPSLLRSSIHTKRKLHGTVTPEKTMVPQTFIHDYFSANNSIDRGWVSNGAMAAFRSLVETPSKRTQSLVVDGHGLPDDMVPKKAQEPVSPISPNTSLQEDQKIAADITPSEELPRRQRRRSKQRDSGNPTIPPDASSQLTTAATNLPASALLRRSLATYLSLSKPRLSFLIVLTTTTAYSLYPIPDILSSTNALAPTTLSTSTLTLAYLTAGTFLSCACANTLNMLFEPKYDALMTRTRNRPLVRKLVTPRAATIFAILCGTSGVALLYLGANPTVAGLSALNIFLYAGVYTPMKRISVLNTWVGAVVGGIPPLMGWAAAAGQTATVEHHSWQDLLFTEDAIGGWLLAALLFAWQFPHFNALSHSIRDEYRNAGYRMLAWTNPAMNGRVAIRYSILMFPICAGLWWAGIVNSGFLVVSTACNAWMTRQAFKFWRSGGAGSSARGLFWASVWQLTLVMVGGLVCKTGIWEGVWEQGVALAAQADEEEDELEDADEGAGGMIDVDLALGAANRPS